MLLYSELSEQLAELGTEITAAVMALESTQKVGNVTATYSGGRKTYDYETAVAESAMVDETLIVSYTTEKIVKSTDYRTLCKDLGIEVPFVKSDPSVKIKVL